MKRVFSIGIAVTFALAAILSACSPTETNDGDVTINLVAANIAFDLQTITVPAGARVTINFDNRDAGVPHNFALYRDSSAQQSIYIGQTIDGQAEITYTFDAPTEPGSYFFRCDPHPAQMTGTFIVQ